MALNHSYKTPLVASSTVDAAAAAAAATPDIMKEDNDGEANNNDNTNGSSSSSPSSSSKMIILRIRRPVLFHFKPGQYAQLRLKEIDNFWHPFSIASGPGSPCLEFYIEVFGEKSWSNKLWHLLNEAEGNTSSNNTNRRIEFEVMGPYGTALGKMEDYSHAIAIGTGTGIVPVLSLFKQHVRQLLRLDPDTFLRTLEERQKKIIEVECAQNDRKGSIASKVSKPCCGGHSGEEEYEEVDHLVVAAAAEGEDEDDELSPSKRQDHQRTCLRSSINRHAELSRWGDLRENIKVMKHSAFVATRSFYGVVLLSAMPVFGIALFGMAISWNTCTFDLPYGMIESFQVLSVIFQALFAFVAFFIWDGTQFFALIDAAICIITPFADWYWFLQYAKDDGQLHPCYVLLYCILIGYMTARCWSMVVRPRHRSWRSIIMRDDGLGGTLDRLEMIWVTRSASLVSKIMPEIHVLWDTLVSEWGRENAAKVCRIAIHITDPNEEACQILRQELCDLDLYQTGVVRFGRPKFSEIIENHTLDMVATRTKSYSLLAFCGSSQLAHEIHHDKISNDMVAAITGNKQHQMEFVSESYGGYKSSSAKQNKFALPNRSLSSSLLLGSLSKRKTVTYAEF